MPAMLSMSALNTVGRVVSTGSVVAQRVRSAGGIEAAGVVVRARWEPVAVFSLPVMLSMSAVDTAGRIVSTDSVVFERKGSTGAVVVAEGVVEQRLYSGWRYSRVPLVWQKRAANPVPVLLSALLLSERFVSGSGVEVARGVVEESMPLHGGILVAEGVFKRACHPSAVLKPSLLFWRASNPVAVLKKPVVLLSSASTPTAVFSSALLSRGRCFRRPCSGYRWCN